MNTVRYGYTKQLDSGVGFDEAIARVTASLKESGFGVITEIDVQQTMKNKLGVDVDQYKILGACNPKIAHEVLQADPFVGLLLPCNVIVFEREGRVTVSAAKPSTMFTLVDDEKLSSKACTVDELIQQTMERL